MEHGVHPTFEIANEKQVINNTSLTTPKEGPRFGRIFPHTLKTPPFTPTDASLDALGQTMTAALPAGANQDSDIPSGYTYFGQFVDHDITRDGTADLPTDVKAGLPLDEIKQLRSPSLDLDSLYDKFFDCPPLIAPDGFHMRVGTTQATPPGPATGLNPIAAVDFAGHDVPRDPQTGKAEIGDPRNDENLIVQQIHNVFLRFHNEVADQVQDSQPAGTSPPVLFALARELVTKHYQWLVLNDFVRRIVDPGVMSEILAGVAGSADIVPNPLVFKVSAMQTPPMPLEFSAAAYRLGHSMIRGGYSWNVIFKATGFQPFFTFTEKSGIIGTGDLIRFPSNWIADWRRMFPLEEVAGFAAFDRVNGEDPIHLNLAFRLDTHLAPILGTLPKGGGNLASRNLIRGSRMGLPSGQDVADAIIAAGDDGTVKLTPAELLQGLDEPTLKIVSDNEFHLKTPLWYYVLKEAELANTGRLGRVGSRIVLETFLALIRCSKTSIFSPSLTNPGALQSFSPNSDSPLRTDGGEPITTMAHLIAFTSEVNPLGDVLL